MIEQILEECQMLTGVVTNDLDYLLFLLLKDGTYFKKEEAQPKALVQEVPSLKEWLKQIV